MNPPNFANMGPPPMGPQGIPPQAGLKRGPNPTHLRIIQLLQANLQQFPPQGWQTTMPMNQRVHNVIQIYTAVRQVKPEMVPEQAIQVAVSFEIKTFQGCTEKSQYEQRCRSKLLDIQQTRTQLAQSMQQQLQNGQYPQMNMAQPQPPAQGNPNQDFNQQQQQLQMQYQMQQRMLQQQQLQQNQMPGMVMPPQAPMQLGNPQLRMQGMPPNMSQAVPPQQQQKPFQLTQEETQQVQNLAQTMSTNATKEQLQNLASTLQQQHPGVPVNQLVMQHFQRVAISKLMDHKRNIANQQAAGLMAGPNGVPMPVPQQNRPMSQGAAPAPNQQPTPVSAAQTFDPSFMGSVDQMRQNGLRSQEAGQVVVPASQGNTQQQRAMGVPAQAMPQNGMNRPTQTPKVTQQPQQVWNQTQTQPNGQQPQQPKAFPNGANGIPRDMLQGQPGGLNNQVRTPQQNSNMPNLTRAFGAQNPQPTMQPQQNTPQTAQQNGSNPPQFMPNGGQRPPMNQQQMQQFISQLPEAERKPYIMKLQARQQQIRQQQLQQQGASMQPQRSQQGQPIPAGPQSVPNPQHTSQTAQQNPLQQQPPINGQAQTQPQQSHAQPPQQLQFEQRRIAREASQSLTNEQEHQMDMLEFPPGILNTGNALSQLPPGITTWGQLKQWVKINISILPTGSDQKLRGLQGLHYQSLQKIAAQQGARNAAPPAQMTVNPNQPSANLQYPPVPQVKPEEIQALRDRHAQLAPYSDEQVRAFVIKGKRESIMRQRALAHQNAQLQVMQQGHTTQGQPQAAPTMQPQQPAPQTQRPQPHQAPKVGGQRAQPGGTPHLPAHSPVPQKGVKRNSSDDVVEVPNPNVAQQRLPPKSQPKAPPANMGQIPHKPAEAQKSQAPPSSRPAEPLQQKQPTTAENIRLDDRFKELFTEIRRSTPQRQPVPMTAETRSKMLASLGKAREMIIRIGPILPAFWKTFRDEHGLKSLIQIYLILAQQYKNEQVNQATPIDHFTVGPEELDQNILMLKSYFTTLMSRLDKNFGNSKASQPVKESTSTLSRANLQQHQNQMAQKLAQERGASMKENNRAPPAPTPVQAQTPPWGPSPPHGVPAYSVPNQLTQDKLQLPLKKRLKKDPGGSTPTTPAQLGTPLAAPSPPIAKSPEIRKIPAPVMLKCTAPDCPEVKGFANQAELDKHMKEHDVKEPIIEDPLQFALEQMRKALNLDENGKQILRPEGSTGGAPPMKLSASMQGVKQEASTPMSRVPTGQSPAPHIKALEPSKAQGTTSTALPNINLPDDPWANSLVRPETIHEAFSPLATLAGPRTWTRIQDNLTPESSSTDTDPAKSSPRPSDVSENDAVKISMDLDKSWVPLNWYDDGYGPSADFSEFELLDLNVDGGGAPTTTEPMDWEAMFGETLEEAQVRVDGEKRRMEREVARGGPAISEEFVRVFGPGELNPPRR